MAIDEIKRQIFIDSEEVCGNTMIDTYLAQEYVEQAYNKAIDDAMDESAKAICIGCGYLDGHICKYKGGNCSVSKPMLEVVAKALGKLKAGGENEN